ncbi:hypothetical protein QJS04_geneDACA012543 [Acorus gramineus]|uniref:Exocyst subunit Exo70 family protein n=1 Tax=Acorus gramineus TaxID=55184 RepID=A0AAV9B4P4_ACOGR|nr:hypothetical protein QJS04_geneDACA012543 [Acorus gramineus]
MERTLPEKSSSFSCREDKPTHHDRSLTTSNSIHVIHHSSKPTTTHDHNVEESISEDEESFPPRHEDFQTSLSRLSDDIDRFILSPPPSSEVPDSVERFVTLIDKELANHDDHPPPPPPPPLLDAIDRLSRLVSAIETHPSAAADRSSAALQRAMAFLEEAFRALLEEPSAASAGEAEEGSFDRCAIDHRKNEEEEVEVEVEPPPYGAETVEALRQVAASMAKAGYEAECLQAFSLSRREALESALAALGFEKISIDDVQKMNWESLEGEIATWIKAFRRSVTSSFPAERALCESVFSDDDEARARALFGNLARGIMIQLLNFAEAVAMTKRSAEKLFKFLDMYETLRDLLPNVRAASPELEQEVSCARARLGEAAVGIFSDLENSIRSDNGKTPVPGGAVHPLTRYVMNYLKYACEYKDTLEQVFLEHRGRTTTTGCDDEEERKSNPFGEQLMGVMGLLDANLEAKSKLYKDISLGYIFLMNNGRYMVQKIKGSAEINGVLGDTWCRRRSYDLRQYHKNYQRETWSRVLGCFRDEGLVTGPKGTVAKPVLKERLKAFNAMFEEIHRTQAAWVVSDEQLQSELRVSLSAVVVPAYRSFLGRFGQHLDSGRQSEKYIRFAPEDLETYIDELFDGNPASIIRRRM